jgi:hypothetical protein
MNDKENLKKTLIILFEKVGPENFLSSSEPIKRKIKKGLIYPSLNEEKFYETQNEVLIELMLKSIIDEEEKK